MAEITGTIKSRNPIAGNPLAVAIDDTLTKEGYAADAKAVGDAMSNKKISFPVQWEETVGEASVSHTISGITLGLLGRECIVPSGYISFDTDWAKETYIVGSTSNLTGLGNPQMLTRGSSLIIAENEIIGEFIIQTGGVNNIYIRLHKNMAAGAKATITGPSLCA